MPFSLYEKRTRGGGITKFEWTFWMAPVQNVSTPQEIEVGRWFLARMCKSTLQIKLQYRFLIYWEFPKWTSFLGEKSQFFHKNGRHFGNSQNIKNLLTLTFSATYFYTFWPKISLLAQFLVELIHNLVEKCIWSSDPMVKPLYFWNFESKYLENE